MLNPTPPLPEKPKTPLKSVFPLIGEVWLCLHTPQAISLYSGNWHYQQMGLLQFASLMGQLCRAAKKDDPYADYYLLQTQQKARELQHEIRACETYHSQQLTQQRGFQVEVFANPQPQKFPIHFANPLVYLGACLLVDLDYVVRQAYTLKQLGVSVTAELRPERLVHVLHQFFSQARKWQYRNITRQDIVANNPKAQKAKELMGELPLPVLNKEQRFIFWPSQAWKNYFS